MMTDEEEEDEEGIQLVASYASLAPILDCCVVEAEGGGAVRSLFLIPFNPDSFSSPRRG